MIQKQEEARPLPGIAATLGAGFDLVTRHLWLVAIPVLLDLFLWLGPRLSFQPLIDDLIGRFLAQPTLIDPTATLEALAGRTNLFSYLSVALTGVPALMTGLTPEKTPLATRAYEVASWGQWVGLLLLLTLAGLMLAAVYYTLIARAAAGPEAKRWGGIAGHSLRSYGRLLALALVFFLLTVAIVLPISIVAAFLGLLSQLMATLVLMAAPVLLLWLVIFMSFTPQGMVLNRRPFFRSLLESVRLFQSNFLAASTLLILVVVIGQVMNWLMLAADDGSWLTLASVLGHAFVSTSLVAALFIFYRDRYGALYGSLFDAGQPGQPQPALENPK